MLLCRMVAVLPRQVAERSRVGCSWVLGTPVRLIHANGTDIQVLGTGSTISTSTPVMTVAMILLPPGGQST